MSTYHVPVLFFGRIFDTEEAVSAFLTKHGTAPPTIRTVWTTKTCCASTI